MNHFTSSWMIQHISGYQKAQMASCSSSTASILPLNVK